MAKTKQIKDFGSLDLKERTYQNEQLTLLTNKLTVDGDQSKALINILYGLTSFQTTVLPRVNDDDKTYVFFTRPDMNLSKTNMFRDRRTMGILKEDNSIQKYVRLMLDQKANQSETSSVVDQHNPFIPILSNTIETLSGFPDIVLESWLSKTGMRKDQYGYVDGFDKIFYTFDLDATFTNVIDEPVSHLISVWGKYMSNIADGTFLPHNHNMLARRVDYETAIWVIVVNRNKRIKKIAKTIGYPMVDPQGRYFNYNRSESKFSEGSKINTRFKCFGVEYNDPILLIEFNMLMMQAHPDIYDTIINEANIMVELPESLYMMTKYRAYPFIDLQYNTLEMIINKNNLDIKDIPNDKKITI